MAKSSNAEQVEAYYSRRESRWGYKYLLKGTKHYGYYPDSSRISMVQAQYLMEKELAASLNLKPHSKVLDAGCGEGVVAIRLAQEFGYDTRGIDILGTSIEIANKNKQKKALGSVGFSVQDYSSTDFPDDFFDGVYTLETLVHSPDYRKTLKEFYRILKPGGVLVNHEYVLDDHLPPRDESDWKIMFTDCPMDEAFKDFRESNIKSIWTNAGFIKLSVRDATKEMVPFMRKLHQIAFVPYYILKFFGKEKNYVNTFAGFRSYQLRNQFHYTILKSYKPKKA